MMKWVSFSVAFMLLAPAAFSEPGADPKPIQVKLEWVYQDLAPGMQVYDISHEQELPLWRTATVSHKEQAPITSEIADATLQMHPGEKKRFALVYTNLTKQPVYFFAAPHSAEPAEYALGFKFKCLCVNHAYKVGAGETWYRIVEFRLAHEFVGDHLTIKHTLIGLDAARAERFNQSMEGNSQSDM